MKRKRANIQCWILGVQLNTKMALRTVHHAVPIARMPWLLSRIQFWFLELVFFSIDHENSVATDTGTATDAMRVWNYPFSCFYRSSMP